MPLFPASQPVLDTSTDPARTPSKRPDSDIALGDPISGYLDTRRSEVPQMEHWLRYQEFERIQMVAHGMKKHASGLGLPELELLGEELETAARNGNSQQTSQQLAKLSDYLSRGIKKLADATR